MNPPVPARGNLLHQTAVRSNLSRGKTAYQYKKWKQGQFTAVQSALCLCNRRNFAIFFKISIAFCRYMEYNKYVLVYSPKIGGGRCEC